MMSLLLQFGKAKPGTQQVKKAQAPVRKNFPAPKGTRSTKKYGKNEQHDQLWLPNTERPGWLDGSMPGLHYHLLQDGILKSLQCKVVTLVNSMRLLDMLERY